MFDINAYLDTIAIKEVSPSDTLIDKTVEQCGELLKRKEKDRKIAQHIKKSLMIAVPAAALLLIGIFIGSRMNLLQGTAVDPVYACFTVDINPSICINVDKQSMVTSLVGQNNDADILVRKLDCVGEPISDAIYEIVEEAKDLGYINEQNKYVLIGCFGINDEERALGSLQDKLENSFGDMINLLFVSGTLEEKTQADSLNVSAGLLKLSHMAQGVSIDKKDKVEDVVDELKSTYSVPELSVSKTACGLLLKWSTLNFEAMGYTGEVTFDIAAADTEQDVKDYNAKILKSFTFQTGDTQKSSFQLTPEISYINSEAEKYYGVYVKYGNVAKLVSNVVCAKMPEAVPPSPKPSVSPTAASSVIQTPKVQQKPDVTGHISGDRVVIQWRKDKSETLSGYKIVASGTNPNPKYPEDGYLKFITDKDTTSIELYEGFGGLKANQSYYFSVTYLYNDGSKVAANAVRLAVPAKKKTQAASTGSSGCQTAAPTQAPSSSGDCTPTSISGSIDGNTARLSWVQINNTRFNGYKVVCSFSNPSPSYPNDGYVKWITDAEQTSCSVDMTKISGYKPEAICYFAITALYDSHSVKKTGNTISLTMPAAPAAASQSEPYISTAINGSLSGTTASLSWDKVTHSEFDGYKVVYSFSNPSPVYPASDYAKWIPNTDTTSCSVDVTTLKGYEAGKTCYFSITVLYGGHKVFKGGNTVSFTVP